MIRPQPMIRLPFYAAARYFPKTVVIPPRISRNMYYVYDPHISFIGPDRVVEVLIGSNRHRVVYLMPTMASRWINNYVIGMVPYFTHPYTRRIFISQISGGRIIADLPPVNVTPLTNQSGNVGTALTPYTFGSAAFKDPDNEQASLTYSAYEIKYGLEQPLPSWLTFVGSSRTFSGTPSSGATGVHTIRVKARDPWGQSGYDDFTYTISSGS
jgi:hypothetical protein